MTINVLLTGATASQSSQDANDRNLRFSGLLKIALSKTGVMPEIKDLPIHTSKKDVSKYESVVVGLAPFGSLSANKIYNALNTVWLTKDSGKLKILFDAPDPHLVYQSFRSIMVNKSLLLKNIYANRSGYSAIESSSEMQMRMFEAMDIILAGDYEIIVPSVPYFSMSRESYGIPVGTSHSDLIALNFDSYMEEFNGISSDSSSLFWLADYPNNKHIKYLSGTLTKPVRKIMANPYETRADVIKRLQNSCGYLLATHKGGLPWWSSNIMLALSSGVPVFSDWTQTQVLGDCWSDLHSNSEDLSVQQRMLFSARQKEQYLENCPDWGISVRQAYNAVAK